jgi:hypothetical protein
MDLDLYGLLVFAIVCCTLINLHRVGFNLLCRWTEEFRGCRTAGDLCGSLDDTNLGKRYRHKFDLDSVILQIFLETRSTI